MYEKEDLQKIVKRYNIGKLVTYIEFSGGQQNILFKITTSTSIYIIRLYKDRSIADMQFELKLLKMLKQLPVCQILKDKKGNEINRSKGRYYMVYEYIPGSTLKSFTTSQLDEVGRFLGKYHKIVEGRFVWKKSRYKFYDLPKRKIEKIERLASRKNLPYLQYLDSLKQDLLRYAPPRTLPQGPIHVDVKPANVLFYKSHLSGVLDFEFSYMGPFILDLARTMATFGTKDGKFDIKKAKIVYEGYAEQRSISKQEKYYLYSAIKYAFVSYVFMDYYMYAVRHTEKSRKYFEWVINDLYAAYKKFSMTEKEFNECLSN